MHYDFCLTWANFLNNRQWSGKWWYHRRECEQIYGASNWILWTAQERTSYLWCLLWKWWVYQRTFLFFFEIHVLLFIYLWLLSLRFCARAFSSCGKRGPLFIAVRGPLTIAASLVAEHRLQTRRLSNCGSWAQLLRGMWDLPRPGLEPVSPALAGRFSTTVPPGKPQRTFLMSLSSELFLESNAIWPFSVIEPI